MNTSNSDFASLILLLIPVFIAIAGLISNFNLIDLIYLILVGVVFLRCYFKMRKQKI